MWFNFRISNLFNFETEAVAAELELHKARFGVRMAQDILKVLPDYSRRGMYVVAYDIEENPISIVPLDPIR